MVILFITSTGHYYVAWLDILQWSVEEFGLTDTGDINISSYNNSTIIGIGTAPNNSYRVNVDGSVRIDGDVVGTGRGVVGSDKYITKTYTGDGATHICSNYLFWWYSTCDDSLLVFLNGVAQIAGTNYTVGPNGANVVFNSGDTFSIRHIHILELPI